MYIPALNASHGDSVANHWELGMIVKLSILLTSADSPWLLWDRSRAGRLMSCQLMVKAQRLLTWKWCIAQESERVLRSEPTWEKLDKS